MAPSRILIVDDDTHALHCLREMVAKLMVGGTVETATSPRQALDRIWSADHQVVLSDIEMPEMSGIDLVRYIMERRSTPTTVLMTEDHTWLTLAIDAGAYSCLPKLVPPDVLAGVLGRAIEYDTLQRRVERFGQVLALQTRATNEYCKEVQARTLGLEKRMAEMHRAELDESIAVWAWHAQPDLSFRA